MLVLLTLPAGNKEFFTVVFAVVVVQLAVVAVVVVQLAVVAADVVAAQLAVEDADEVALVALGAAETAAFVQPVERFAQAAAEVYSEALAVAGGPEYAFVQSAVLE